MLGSRSFGATPEKRGIIATPTMETPRRGERRIAAAASLVLVVLLACWIAKSRKDEDAIVPDAAAVAESGVDDQTREGSEPAHLDFTAATATIQGSVRDPAGAPIPDAQVCAVSDVDARLGIDDRKPHCVRSDADGSYLIDGLLPIATEVHASAPSFKPARWELGEGPGWPRTKVHLRAGRSVSEVDLILEPGGVLLRGVTKDISGGEIDGALIVVVRRGEGSAFTTADENGEFQQWVAPGEIELFAQAEGYANGAIAAVAPGEFVELFMTPESVLVGRVVLAGSGEPVADAVVSAGRSIPTSHGGPTSTRTDAEGRFRIDRLQPGSFKPTAETDTLWGQAAEQVHLGLGVTSEQVLIHVHPAALVAGRVVIAGSDRPCTDGSVRLESLDGKKWADIDQEGHVEFRGLFPGTYQVRVYCPGFISAEHYPEVIVARAELDEIEWEVHEGFTLRGLVVDDAGGPAADVEVLAHQVVEPDAARSRTTNGSGLSGPDGSFELAGLLPGRYEITTPSWRGRPIRSEPLVVELRSDADLDDVRLRLPPFGRVRGRVFDETGKPVSGAVLAASLVGGQSYGQSRSNDAGEFEIDNLSVGLTRVTAIDGDAFGRGAVMRKPGTTDDDLQGELVELVANEFVEVTLTVEARDGRITGVVTDSLGRPASDAFIDVERIPDGSGGNSAAARASVRWSWGSQPTLTEADGRFELEGLPEGKFIIRANRKGGGEALAEAIALDSHVQLVITETGELAGKVEFLDGNSPERFSIFVEDKTQGISLIDSFFRTDGNWRLTEVPAGSYLITVSSALGSTTLETTVELGAGEVRGGIELTLDPRVSLRGRIIDLETREPVAGLAVSVAGTVGSAGGRGGKDGHHITDVDGRFELDDVPVGKVTLFAWSRSTVSETKYDYFQQPLFIATEPAVQDLGEIEIVAKRIDTHEKAGDLGYRIDDWDPSVPPEDFKAVVATVRVDGPAANSGIAPGDVIEKVQGHDVTGVHGGRYDTLTRVPEGTKVTLELENGKTVDIVAGPAI